VSKFVGCEPPEKPWWQPADIKFNSKAAGSSASRKVPVTVEDVNEAAVEDAFFRTFKNALLSADVVARGVHWFDGHSTHWLRRPSSDASLLAPDGVCFDRPVVGMNPDARHIIGINDNKMSRNGKFSHDDRGKILNYLGIIMEHYQKDRHEIGASLFDGRYAQCFRLERSSHFRNWRLHCSTVMDCSVQADAQLFAGFLRSKSAFGWTEGDVPSECGLLLGVGSVGRVFMHSSHQGCVVKVARQGDNNYLRVERNNLLAIKDAGVDMRNMVHLSKHDSNDPGFIVLAPVFDSVCPWPSKGRINLDSLADFVIGPIKALHRAGFVHCDLRPENIMRRRGGDNSLVMIDFGAARLQTTDVLFEHGTLSFASSRVLTAFIKNDPLRITSADDLESLVYVTYAMLWMTPEEVASELLSLKGNLSDLERFWSSRVGNWESTLLAAARAGQHGELASEIRRLKIGLPSISE
jgi:hypothetical protein